MLQKIKKNKEEVNDHTGTVEEKILGELKGLTKLTSGLNKKIDENDKKYRQELSELKMSH